MTPDSELGSILGRWHQWRAAYSHERKASRAALFRSAAPMDDDDFEAMLMRQVEAEIDGMSTEHQRALQHVARAQCLGVEVIFSNRLPSTSSQRDTLCREALRVLCDRLTRSGLL